MKIGIYKWTEEAPLPLQGSNLQNPRTFRKKGTQIYLCLTRLVHASRPRLQNLCGEAQKSG